MRERDALKLAKQFVVQNYPSYAPHYIEVALEHDGERRKSWSFGIHVDREDPDFRPGDEEGPVGYVHADGYVEGLYGANR